MPCRAPHCTSLYLFFLLCYKKIQNASSINGNNSSAFDDTQSTQDTLGPNMTDLSDVNGLDDDDAKCVSNLKPVTIDQAR